MNTIEENRKIIPIIERFIPNLEKEIQKWDGKVMNKKFYTSIEKYCNEWYDKTFTTEEKSPNKVFFYTDGSYINTNSRTLEIKNKYDKYTLLYTWDKKQWQTQENGKQPRINADAIIKNLHEYATKRKEKLIKIENTISRKKEIMEAYKKIIELSVFISKNKYDRDTMIQNFQFDEKTLAHINNVKYAGNWLAN